MSYFVIRNSDGDTYVDEVSEEVLQLRLTEEYYGPRGFLKKIPGNDTNYWGNNILIIKGSIVVPQAVQTVTEYKL
jgi:hypothetical protein